ncbi:MAG: TAXI family TRAP transporter solute-binding subunit [Firmicutes bacterium]|nr:TAXI family TRAP transporter solute-binding subunit [Bacillota bacterium]
MKRILTLGVLLLVVALVAAGCGGGGGQQQQPQQGSEQPAPAAQEQKMVLATGGAAGTYYPLGGGMASIWNSKLQGYNVTAQATGASVENLRLVEQKEVELALTQNDIAEYAHKGIEAFEGQAITSSVGIATLYPEVIQIIVPKESPIKSITDLKGRKVSVGAPGSGNEANARQILDVFGLSYKDIEPFYLSYAESADQFKDNHIDVIMLTTGAPNAGIQDVATVKAIRVLPFTEEEVKKIQEKYPFFSTFTLPANTYTGQTEDVLTIAVQACFFGHKDLPEDVVYDLTKTLWENKDELARINAKAEYMDPDDPVKGITVPIHPGALKYYKEAGVTNLP